MDDLYPVFATAAVILVYFLFKAVNGSSDPFAADVAFLRRLYSCLCRASTDLSRVAVGVRGKELVWAANMRACGSLFGS